MSEGGDERPPGPRGLRTGADWEISLTRSVGGVTVPSLNSSVAVESLWVSGEGRWPSFRWVWASLEDDRWRCKRRGFLDSV